MAFIRAYLRASTGGQDASRARGQLDAFVNERGLSIASYYIENESGASLQRPELFRLLGECKPNDILLTEQVDRLSRLNASDWEKLRADIKQRNVRVVALDLPTSWTMLEKGKDGDDFTGRMFQAINDMMLDMLAAIARKDYEDRRRRQAEGIVKAKASNLFKGRKEDEERNARIVDRLNRGESWSSIIKAEKRGNQTLSRSTLSRLRLRSLTQQSASSSPTEATPKRE
jgi:DNA invertase Pin-like site-specific DNA recombinase